MSEEDLDGSSILVASSQIASDIQCHSNKRPLFEIGQEVCASSENKPLTCYSKRQRTMSGNTEVDPASDLLEKQVCGLNKKSGLDPSTHLVNNSNPLSERNIRVDCDNNNAPNKNISYVKSLHETNNLIDKNSLNNDVTPALSYQLPGSLPNITTQNVYQAEQDIDNHNLNSESNSSLKSAISSLEVGDEVLSSSSSTLDYVAQLPDRCMPLEDVSATPPHTVANAHYSGDEDDDNYLDSSEGEHEEDNTDNTADESCGEGKPFVTVPVFYNNINFVFKTCISILVCFYQFFSVITNLIAGR